MPEGDILHDTAGDCSDKELLTARGRNDDYKLLLVDGMMLVDRMMTWTE